MSRSCGFGNMASTYLWKMILRRILRILRMIALTTDDEWESELSEEDTLKYAEVYKTLRAVSFT